MKTPILVMLTLVASTCLCLAAGDEKLPASAPTAAASPASAPASQPASEPYTPPPTEPAVMDILKKLEAAGETHKTIRCELQMLVTDRLTGDSELREGWLAYQKDTGPETPGGFRVHFDTLKLGEGPAIKDEVDYAFDGAYFTVAKHRIKDMQRYQVAAEGEKVEPMRLGKGPFPLPFGQKVDEVLARFEVKTRPAKPTDPPDTTYLEFVPRRDRYDESDFTRLEMWVDSKSFLPVKLISADKKKKVTAVTFQKLQTNVPVDAANMFHMPQPVGWNYHVERLEK